MEYYDDGIPRCYQVYVDELKRKILMARADQIAKRLGMDD